MIKETKNMNEAVNKTQQVKLSLINIIEFINFLKKFSTQEPNILMELRGSEKLIIKTATPKTANIIKVGEIDFDEIFMTDDNIPDNILIGLYNIGNFINTFSLLDEDKIDITIFYEKNKKNELIGKRITIETENLKYHFTNAPRESFQYLEDELVNRIFNPDTFAFSFDLDKNLLLKIQKLVNNEASKAFTLCAEIGENVYFKAKQFELKVTSPQTINDNASILIGKQYLGVIDRDDYEVMVVDKGMLLKSKNSKILIAIAREKPPEITLDNNEMEIL